MISWFFRLLVLAALLAVGFVALNRRQVIGRVEETTERVDDGLRRVEDRVEDARDKAEDAQDRARKARKLVR